MKSVNVNAQKVNVNITTFYLSIPAVELTQLTDCPCQTTALKSRTVP